MHDVVDLDVELHMVMEHSVASVDIVEGMRTFVVEVAVLVDRKDSEYVDHDQKVKLLKLESLIVEYDSSSADMADHPFAPRPYLILVFLFFKSVNGFPLMSLFFFNAK
jgi:hypothetical protein